MITWIKWNTWMCHKLFCDTHLLNEWNAWIIRNHTYTHTPIHPTSPFSLPETRSFMTLQQDEQEKEEEALITTTTPISLPLLLNNRKYRTFWTLYVASLENVLHADCMVIHLSLRTSWNKNTTHVSREMWRAVYWNNEQQPLNKYIVVALSCIGGEKFIL